MDYLQYSYEPITYCLELLSVLNLIINGLPSIQGIRQLSPEELKGGFKPYYKWITFNTYLTWYRSVLLFFSFKPYYKWITFNTIPRKYLVPFQNEECFKPYYKWITFNTPTKSCLT